MAKYDYGNRGPDYRKTETRRYPGDRPNYANNGAQPRSTRKPRKPKGPSIIYPKTPSSGKECRKMMKATAYRLARLVRLPASQVYKDDILVTVEKPIADETRYAEARGLARKLVRLRAWYNAA